MTLRIIITGVDNGYIIIKSKPDLPGIPEQTLIAEDAVDVLDTVATILDMSNHEMKTLARRWSVS